MSLLTVRPTLSAAVIFAASAAFAHQDTPLAWHTAMIGFGDPKEKNVLRVSVNESQELTQFTVHWRGQDFSVPSTEFKSVPKVQLQSVRTAYSGDHPLPIIFGAPYLNVSLHFGDIAFGEYPLAWFIFERGKFRSITLIKRTSEKTTEYIDTYPGKDPVVGGVSSVLEPPP